jgi:hypothetical protein
MKYDVALQMFSKVSETLEKNLPKWDEISAFREIYDEFMKNLVKLKKLSEKQIKKPATLLNKKDKLLNQLTEKVIPVANILQVYSTDYKEKKIKPVKIIKEKLIHTKDSVILKKCGYVLAKSRKLFNKALKKGQKINNEGTQSNILGYGLTERMIHELEASYDQFKEESDYIGSILSQEKKIMGKMKTLVRKNKKLLSKKLDKLMILFESKDPEFHRLYKQSREAAASPEVNKGSNPVGRPRKTQSNKTQQSKTQPNKTQQSKTQQRKTQQRKTQQRKTHSRRRKTIQKIKPVTPKSGE